MAANKAEDGVDGLVELEEVGEDEHLKDAVDAEERVAAPEHLFVRL